MSETGSFSFAITDEQKVRILALNMGKLYSSILGLLLLARYRQSIQPDIGVMFTKRYTGGKQHVCSLDNHTADLAKWFRKYWPGCTGRAIVEVGLMTWDEWTRQGYATFQILHFIEQQKQELWRTPGL